MAQKIPFKIQGFVQVLSTHIYASFNDLRKPIYPLPLWGFLEKMKQIIQVIPTGARRTSWLFYMCGRGFELRTIKNKSR